MRVLKLLDLSEFASYVTVGPSGEHRADINCRGAAIECYLDSGGRVVRWNNFNKELGVYQGELVGKGDVLRRFYELAEPRPDYDLSRISAASRMAVHSAMTMFKTALIRERS